MYNVMWVWMNTRPLSWATTIVTNTNTNCQCQCQVFSLQVFKFVKQNMPLKLTVKTENASKNSCLLLWCLKPNSSIKGAFVQQSSKICHGMVTTKLDIPTWFDHSIIWSTATNWGAMIGWVQNEMVICASFQSFFQDVVRKKPCAFMDKYNGTDSPANCKHHCTKHGEIAIESVLFSHCAPILAHRARDQNDLLGGKLRHLDLLSIEIEVSNMFKFKFKSIHQVPKSKSHLSFKFNQVGSRNKPKPNIIFFFEMIDRIDLLVDLNWIWFLMVWWIGLGHVGSPVTRYVSFTLPMACFPFIASTLSFRFPFLLISWTRASNNSSPICPMRCCKSWISCFAFAFIADGFFFLGSHDDGCHVVVRRAHNEVTMWKTNVWILTIELNGNVLVLLYCTALVKEYIIVICNLKYCAFACSIGSVQFSSVSPVYQVQVV